MMAPSTPTGTRSTSAGGSSRLGDAAAGDDRTSVAPQTSCRELGEVRALEHAVLVHVGDDVAGASLVIEPSQHLVEVAALAGPATRRQRGPTRTSSPTATRSPHSAMAAGAPRAGCSSAAVPMLTRRQPVAIAAASGGVVVADAAAQLHLGRRSCARRSRAGFAVVAAPEGRVEVDEVDPLGPCLLPAEGGLHGIPEALLRDPRPPGRAGPPVRPRRRRRAAARGGPTRRRPYRAPRPRCRCAVSRRTTATISPDRKRPAGVQDDGVRGWRPTRRTGGRAPRT